MHILAIRRGMTISNLQFAEIKINKKQQERKGHHLSVIVGVSTKASKAANSIKEIIYFMYWRLLLCTVWMG
jgi:hypothetical protein